MGIRFLTLFLFLTTLTALRASLVWTPDEGWHVVGRNTDHLVGPSGEDYTSALDLMNEARLEQEEGNQWSALDLYKEVVSDYPNSVFAPEAIYQRGVIYADRHQFETATKEFQKIIKKYPNYEGFNLVVQQLYNIGEKVQDGALPYYWGLFPGFYNADMSTKAYEEVVQSAPYSDYAPMALMNLAMVANDNDKPEEAIDALDRLINNYPDSFITSDAYLSLAQTYGALVQGPQYDQGATRQSISYYKDFLILFPDSTSVSEAEAGLYYMEETLAANRYDMGTFYWEYRNNPRAALIFLNEAITVAPDSPSARKARELIIEIKSGEKPPMTPYDWVFGRYKEPSDRQYDEQSEIDMLEDEGFQIEQTEDFLTTPGAEAAEIYDPATGTTEDYMGVGAPLMDPYLDDPIMEPYEGMWPADPLIGPEFGVDNLFPVQLPGPNTPQQEAVDKEQTEAAENQNLPAGAQ
ncbi:tetratricopeptide repeat protein [Ruficoccus amylovorans]|uniref:Tetratricopeptide repeat protein n=1 Tax=Ruficoccus amylovorans TaxID=1804625 RepID=A0A842H9W3_9BACT|nr:tetratricopeptide repeat protein [Ruficoccus amylovorans]MBC2593100.1 tetratricopeptide repeat protein [Ruficoccus amylovorans]